MKQKLKYHLIISSLSIIMSVSLCSLASATHLLTDSTQPPEEDIVLNDTYDFEFFSKDNLINASIGMNNFAKMQIISKQGCCSSHSGVCGCLNGQAICCDGWPRSSCSCYKEENEQNVEYAQNAQNLQIYYQDNLCLKKSMSGYDKNLHYWTYDHWTSSYVNYGTQETYTGVNAIIRCK